ncbi:hypothetical protein D9619_005499 [Psilocybe cf. subviscida]|uniref:DNA 3'-5' helicase n=1 Tax=Psilocybe cf. subviscida TaxID=2480587 RepID=A0A8H5BWN4_9AGAR|nr:hypothetical protein D9619_005499 [Psilocybe cf. subviscida]
MTVHILNESRGSTLEVVVSRMKFRGSAIRFILVSATVPNTDDVAGWVGRCEGSTDSAQIFEHVVGIPRRTGQNDFQFAKILDYKVFTILQEYSVGKPILIFCATRKAFAEIGIGLHHAGLTMDDRRATERLYLNKTLRVLIATSGVTTYQNNLAKEYSDLDIVQMLGRAGRPQFDRDGIAIILCESELEHKYSALVHGRTVLESSLHINLAEHLNSEIGLGTISNIDTAKKWLATSFLSHRMQKNPDYYCLDSALSTCTSSNSVDDIVMSSITQLKAANLIDYVDHGADKGKLCTTQYGQIMSKYYIRRGTVSAIPSSKS